MPPPADQTAAVVIIGDEILSGKFPEENARYLVAQLRELGVQLRRITVIPDLVEEIAATVADYSRQFDLVFTSGGIGPTHDDLTMKGIAAAFGTQVVLHERLSAAILELMGPDRGPQNLRLAEVPDGAELVGPGKWPVACYRNVYILPGVPAIFRTKFDSIKETFRARPFAQARVYCAADEASLASHLNAVVDEFSTVAIGSYPRYDETDYQVVVTFEGKDPAPVRIAAESLAARLGPLVVKVES